MPYMTIMRGVDGLWHSRPHYLEAGERKCHVKQVGNVRRMGGDPTSSSHPEGYIKQPAQHRDPFTAGERWAMEGEGEEEAQPTEDE